MAKAWPLDGLQPRPHLGRGHADCRRALLSAWDAEERRSRASRVVYLANSHKIQLEAVRCHIAHRYLAKHCTQEIPKRALPACTSFLTPYPLVVVPLACMRLIKKRTCSWPPCQKVRGPRNQSATLSHVDGIMFRRKSEFGCWMPWCERLTVLAGAGWGCRLTGSLAGCTLRGSQRVSTLRQLKALSSINQKTVQGEYSKQHQSSSE